MGRLECVSQATPSVRRPTAATRRMSAGTSGSSGMAGLRDTCRVCSGSTCDDCVRSGQGCGWCAETGTCGPSSSFGDMCVGVKASKCSNWQGCLRKEPSQSCPAVRCSDFDTCSACAGNRGCGWCASSQTCMEGDSFVGLCKDCAHGIGCFKSKNDDKCPEKRCSSFTMCSGCTAQKGCGWDAAELKCVELTQGGSLGSCPASTVGCLFETSDQCPHTPTQQCSFYKSCRACAEDPACGWSSGLNECVEASTSMLNGCRGDGAFSFRDCEPHCHSISDCDACLEENSADCTWCVGERLNANRTKVERCVLAKGGIGGKAGRADRREPEYEEHVCQYTIAEKAECDSCASKGFKSKLHMMQDKGSFSACTSDPKCVACEYETEKHGLVSDCVRGDEEGPFSSCRLPPDTGSSLKGAFWAHSPDTPIGAHHDSPQCGNQDVCRTATTCRECMSWDRREQGCVWCNHTEPLSGETTIGSRCRASTECPSEFSNENFECPLQVEPTCTETGRDGGCTACVARKDCAFAPSENLCVPHSTPFSFNFLPYVWGDAGKCPEVCVRHKNCKACASSDDACGWCGSTSTCLPLGRSKDPLTEGPDFLSTGRTCSPFVVSFATEACGSAEEEEEEKEGGKGKGEEKEETGGKGESEKGKTDEEGEKQKNAESEKEKREDRSADGWIIALLVLLIAVIFVTWSLCFRCWNCLYWRPHRGVTVRLAV